MLFLRRLTDRITIFVVTPNVRYSEQQQRQLDAAGICTVHEPVSAIRLSNGSVTLRHGDSQTECDALYGALGLKVHSELATALGARYAATSRAACGSTSTTRPASRACTPSATWRRA